MEPIQSRDKYPKAKIEEPNLRLPKALLKPDGDPKDDLCYMKIFEDDTKRAQHLAEAIATGEKLDRKVYRIRNKELVKFVGKDFEGMSEIHKASKATIGILADAESNLHSHSYLDLVGTVEEVSIAEGLILDNTLKTYSTLAYPVILMPPTIYGDYIIIPVNKVSRVLGTYNINILRMEMESGAWIKIEPGAPPGGSEQEKLINVFGPRENVIKAIKLIRAITYEPTEASAAQEELWREFNEPCWREFFERKEAEEAILKESGESEKGKQQAEEGGSGDDRESRAKEAAVEGCESEKKEKQSSTFLRMKPEGSKSKETVEGEFKVPRWSQTFGHIKSVNDDHEPEILGKEEGGSGVTEKEHVHEDEFKEAESEKEKGEAKLKEYSGELEKGKQQTEAGGSGEPTIEKNEHDVKEAEAESLKKKSKKLIIRLKKSGGGEGAKQTEGGKDNESGELEKGKQQAEAGGSGEPTIEKNEHDVKEAEAESLKKKSKKLIIRLKKSGGGEGAKQTEGGKDNESGELEKGKQQAEAGGSGEPTIEKNEHDVKEAEAESLKKKSKKLIIRLKKSGGGEGAKQTEGGKDNESGELEKGKQQAEAGGSGEPTIEKQPEHVRAHDSAKTEDDKEGDYRSKEKRQVEDVDQAKSEKEKGGKLIMEQKAKAAARDKYPKAKIEEPNLRLPKALLKPDSDSTTDDLTYMKIFEDDARRAQHLAEAIAGGAKLDRKVYRIRNKELVKFIGKDFEGMSEVHKASKATIGILADSESNLHSHSYIDLVGTVEEVNSAEGLILDNILKTYSTLAYPVILMPPTIYGDHIIIPANKVIRVLGSFGTNILRMEMESGAWIKIEPGAPPGGSERERLINVFGPRENVIKAIKLIRAVTYEPAEASAAQEELWREFNEPCWREFFERKEAEEGMLKESGEPEKGKQAGEGVSSDHSKKKSGDDGESEKNKSKKPSGIQVVERKKSVKMKTQHQHGRSPTFLRRKSLSEGSKRTEEGESDKKKNEFKEPSLSETFGRMKIGGGKSEESGDQSEKGKQQQAEEGGSNLKEKEKQEEHVEEEADGDEQKEKSQEDVEEASAKGKESQDESGQESAAG